MQYTLVNSTEGLFTTEERWTVPVGTIGSLVYVQKTVRFSGKTSNVVCTFVPAGSSNSKCPVKVGGIQSFFDLEFIYRDKIDANNDQKNAVNCVYNVLNFFKMDKIGKMIPTLFDKYIEQFRRYLEKRTDMDQDEIQEYVDDIAQRFRDDPDRIKDIIRHGFRCRRGVDVDINCVDWTDSVVFGKNDGTLYCFTEDTFDSEDRYCWRILRSYQDIGIVFFP